MVQRYLHEGFRRENPEQALALAQTLLRQDPKAYAWACEAVAYAHARGVVHRDLKPANVMLGRFGEVILLDWGLAKVLGRPEAIDAGASVPAAGPATREARDGN